jgi:hypothetical protein
MAQRRHEKRTATRRPWPALLTLTERLSPRSSFFKHRLHIGASNRVDRRMSSDLRQDVSGVHGLSGADELHVGQVVDDAVVEREEPLGASRRMAARLRVRDEPNDWPRPVEMKER